MNNKFKPNPIIIKNQNKILDIVELDFDFEENDIFLKIIDKNDSILYNDLVSENTFIELDVSKEKVKLIYKNPLNDEVLKENSINLSKYNISVEELMLKAEKEKEDSFYRKVALQVKEEMDNPKGTLKECEEHTLMLKNSTISNKARSYVESKIRQIVSKNDISEEKVEEYSKKIYSNFYGMGILQELDDDKDVGEILVNGFVFPVFHCDVYYYLNGEKLKYDKTFNSLDDLLNVYSRAISYQNKELNNVENALIETSRANRDRVNIIIPDASESYVLNIRKFRNFVPDLNNMKQFGTVDDFIDKLMDILVRGKVNIGIGGEMGTGKTTFINYLLTYTKPSERKVIIASVSETDIERVLKGHDVVILNVDEQKKFTFSKLIRASLRTTAARVIVPESRGEEFKQVYEANLKTKGNMFTAHALSDYEFLDMCVDMYIGDNGSSSIESIRNKIAKSIDIIIIMRKVGHKIRIDSISELVLDEKKNFEKMNLLYYWESDPEDCTLGKYVRTDNRLTDATKKNLNKHGVPMSELLDL